MIYDVVEAKVREMEAKGEDFDEEELLVALKRKHINPTYHKWTRMQR